jgi:hypothetical protein
MNESGERSMQAIPTFWRDDREKKRNAQGNYIPCKCFKYLSVPAEGILLEFSACFI